MHILSSFLRKDSLIITFSWMKRTEILPVYDRQTGLQWTVLQKYCTSTVNCSPEILYKYTAYLLNLYQFPFLWIPSICVYYLQSVVRMLPYFKFFFNIIKVIFVLIIFSLFLSHSCKFYELSIICIVSFFLIWILSLIEFFLYLVHLTLFLYLCTGATY